jgi:hypothetical protein
MSADVNPLENPQVWDAIEIGGVEAPGVCKLGTVKREYEWDVKKGKGSAGATITFVGRPPVKFSVTFYLWTVDHFTEWDDFRPLLKYTPTKKAVQAIDIWHPALADIECNSVVCEGIGAIEHDGDGLYSCSVDFLEYWPPPKASAVSTPSTSATSPGAGSGSSGAPPGVPQDPALVAAQNGFGDALGDAKSLGPL